MRVLLALLLLLGIVGTGWLWWASRAPQEEAPPVRVVVEPGTSARELGQRLAERGVIRSATLFEAWIRVRGDAGRIQAGTYELPRDHALPTVVEMLVSGETVLVAVTIPEGFRIEQTARAVARNLGIDSSAFARIAYDTLLADSLLPEALVGADPMSLEGYLLPETYRVDPSTDEREMAREMVAHFWIVFSPRWRARADSLQRSVHEIVTLASIVEEEAKVPEERSMIAGVFWNRLALGMPLEADPTVQYALGGHRERVLYRDLEVESPYNTYRNPGLPPGPIASPGRAALEATLWPDPVPYLYFFATGEDGRHTFSETLAEHERKRRQRNR